MPTRSIPDSTRRRVVTMYRAGKKVAAIATATGVSRGTIYRVLNQAGINTSRTSTPNGERGAVGPCSNGIDMASENERLRAELDGERAAKAASVGVLEGLIRSLNDDRAGPAAAKEIDVVDANDAFSPFGNLLTLLLLAMRESLRKGNEVKQSTEDKKYFLQKLREFNIIARELSEYLSELVEASQQLSQLEKDRIEVNVKNLHLSVADAETTLVTTSSRKMRLDRVALTDTIKAVGSMQEVIRNERQMVTILYEGMTRGRSSCCTIA